MIHNLLGLKDNKTSNFADEAENPVGVKFEDITVTVESVIFGDVNSDGDVDTIDSIRLVRYLVDLVELTPAQKKAADVNYTCSCGDSYVTDYVAALGHDWGDGVVTTKPTETSEGVKTFTCSRCGTTKTESVPALDHTHSYTATVTPPTCTEKGYTTYTCACGDSYVADYVDVLGVSPSRLHYGPTANYGSIIIPVAFHCLIRSKRIFQNGSESLATLLSVITRRGRRVLAYLHSAGLSPRTGMYLMNVYSVVKVHRGFLSLKG